MTGLRTAIYFTSLRMMGVHQVKSLVAVLIITEGENLLLLLAFGECAAV